MTKSMKVLIAYDGSPGADEAIEELWRAGLPKDVEAVVLSVADIWILPNGEPVVFAPAHLSLRKGKPHPTAASMMDVASTRAKGACERLSAKFPTWQVTAKSLADSPAWAIVLEAESWQADLIVVGSHGHSLLDRVDRWILGSVSQTVLTQAPCSVRIGRRRPSAPNRPLRILIGIDGSLEAEMAVRTMAERVWPAGTDIRLMTVLEPSILEAMNHSPLATDSSSAPPHQQAGGMKDILDNHLAIFQEKTAELNVSTMLMAGDPKRVLVEEAERWGADCIVMGARGLNPWHRLLLGSVSTAVATRAHCPVEVVRTPRPLS